MKLLQLFDHDRVHIREPLPDAVAFALVSCFGTGRDVISPDRALAKTFLLDLRSRECWIACGCRGDGTFPPPLMSPRLRQADIHIHRHGVTPHHSTCPFFVDEYLPRESGEGALVRDNSDWLHLGRTVDHSPSAVSVRYISTVPKLGRLMFDTLEKVGYTTILPSDVVTGRNRKAASARNDSYAGLDKLHDLIVAGDIRWRDIGCTYLPGLRKHLQHLEILVPRFPKEILPQGIFLGIVHELSDLSGSRGQLLWRSAQG